MKKLSPFLWGFLALFSECSATDGLTLRCQEYAELGLYHRIVADIETEKARLDQQPGADKNTRLQLLAALLDSHMEKLLQLRRYCDVSRHWYGVGAYGYEQYRTADFPSDLQERPVTENRERMLEWYEKMLHTESNHPMLNY